MDQAFDDEAGVVKVSLPLVIQVGCRVPAASGGGGRDCFLAKAREPVRFLHVSSELVIGGGIVSSRIWVEMEWALIISLAFSGLGLGVVISVPASDLGLFSLDLDSDGFAEFESFYFYQEASQIYFLTHVDGIDRSTTLPDEEFVGIRWGVFASTQDLAASSMFSGDLLVPEGFNRLYDSIQGVMTIDEAEPLFAAWVYGSLGTGSDDLRLLGMVVDASDFFSSGGTADLRIFFHDYGSFGGGDGINGASLAQTGVLSEALSRLDSVAEFIGPKSGLIRVPSQIGKTCQLKRGRSPGSGDTIATLLGTGQVLTLSWDDTETSDAGDDAGGAIQAFGVLFVVLFEGVEIDLRADRPGGVQGAAAPALGKGGSPARVAGEGSVVLLVLLDLGDHAVEKFGANFLGIGRRHLVLEVGDDLGGEKGVHVAADLRLDLGVADAGDVEGVGISLGDFPQEEIRRT
jgi:hypothetical protein